MRVSDGVTYTEVPVSGAEIARRAGLSRARVQQLRADGVPDAVIIAGTYERRRSGRRPSDLTKGDPRGALIGARVRRYRDHALLRQTDLAALAGMKRESLCRLEQGAHTPGLDVLSRIALALHIEVSWLVEGVEIV